MTEERKKRLKNLVTEAIRVLKEQDAAGMAPAGSAVPPSPVAPPPATNAATPPPAAGTQAPPGAGGEEPKPFDVDALIDRLNTIRGGKSFADPEVYGQLTTYFKGLADADKGIIDRFLESITKIIVQVDPNSAQGSGSTPSAQPPMNQGAPPVAAAPAPSAGPVAEGLDLAEEVDALTESVKPGAKYTINGKELDFGSPEHVRILKGMLAGMQSLRDCYGPGTSHRHVYSSACGKLRKLIDRLSSAG